MHKEVIWAEKPQHNSCQIHDYQVRYMRCAKPVRMKTEQFWDNNGKTKQNNTKTKMKIAFPIVDSKLKLKLKLKL